jgi:hypothetical protein
MDADVGSVVQRTILAYEVPEMFRNLGVLESFV